MYNNKKKKKMGARVSEWMTELGKRERQKEIGREREKTSAMKRSTSKTFRIHINNMCESE